MSEKLSERKTVKRTFREGLVDPNPILEVIDLRTIAQSLVPKKDFVYLKRIIWYLRFERDRYILTEFCEGAALASGIQIKYDELELLDNPIVTNADFQKYAHDWIFDVDAGATKQTVFTCRFSFWKFVRNQLGLRMDGHHTFSIEVQDDLSAVGLEIKATLEGWGFER